MATNRVDGTVALIDLSTHRNGRQFPARNGADSTALAFFPERTETGDRRSERPA